MGNSGWGAKQLLLRGEESHEEAGQQEISIHHEAARRLAEGKDMLTICVALCALGLGLWVVPIEGGLVEELEAKHGSSQVNFIAGFKHRPALAMMNGAAQSIAHNPQPAVPIAFIPAIIENPILSRLLRM